MVLFGMIRYLLLVLLVFIVLLRHSIIIHVQRPVYLLHFLFCHLPPILFLEASDGVELGILPGKANLGMTDCSVDGLLDFAFTWQLVTKIAGFMWELKLIRHKSKIKLTGVLELVAIAGLIDFISSVLAVAFNHSIVVAQPFLFVCS